MIRELSVLMRTMHITAGEGRGGRALYFSRLFLVVRALDSIWVMSAPLTTSWQDNTSGLTMVFRLTSVCPFSISFHLSLFSTLFFFPSPLFFSPFALVCFPVNRPCRRNFSNTGCIVRWFLAKTLTNYLLSLTLSSIYSSSLVSTSFQFYDFP